MDKKLTTLNLSPDQNGERLRISNFTQSVMARDFYYRSGIKASADSRGAGERIIAMFNSAIGEIKPENESMHCFVDGGKPIIYDGKQLHIGACERHEENLELLAERIKGNNEIVTPRIIAACKKEIIQVKSGGRDGTE